MKIRHTCQTLAPSFALGLLRRWRQRGKLAVFPKRIVEHCYMGYPLRVHVEDELGADWYDTDYPDLVAVLELQRSRLKPGARVFYLGAHQSVIAMIMACIVGPKGQVVAIEANPHNADLGRRNAELNGLKQLIVLHAAAAEHDGHIAVNCCLNSQVDDGSAGWGSMKVRAISLDTLTDTYGTPDVIIVDVEGYEQAVLRGGSRTLDLHPAWCIEVHSNSGLEKFGGNWRDVAREFQCRDYELLAAASEQAPYEQLVDDGKWGSSRFFILANHSPASPGASAKEGLARETEHTTMKLSEEELKVGNREVL